MDKATRLYYEEHAKEYFEKTKCLSVNHLRKTFLSLLPPRAKILDLGCGSGRDLKYFGSLGYEAVGLEQSEALRKHAQEYSGACVLGGDMLHLPFTEESFDALWCCASLVHFTRTELRQALVEIVRVAKKGAVLFLSWKEGRKKIKGIDGRSFFLYNQKSLKPLISGFSLYPQVWQKNISEDGTPWLNLLTRVNSPEKTKKNQMTTVAAVEWGHRILQEAGVEESRKEAQWLLENVVKQEKAAWYRSPEKRLSSRQEEKFLAYIQKRAKHCPFAYITGEAPFMEFTFRVTKDVLIPRPETELLVEYVVKKGGQAPCLGLDMGTGSGCIALSILKYLPQSRFVAIDLSQRALRVASQNAHRLGVGDRVLFLEGDLFENIFPSPTFDWILSNPPYIAQKEYATLMPDVKDYEPKMALVAHDGFSFYRRILKKAAAFLKPNGLLLLELGYGQRKTVESFLGPVWKKKEVLLDLAGIERVFVLEKKES